MDLPGGTSPLRVNLQFELLGIHAIDDEAESLNFTGLLTLNWKDPAQAFDPAEEGVQERVFSGDFQFNEISPGWFPQVVLTNALSAPNSQGVLVRVSPDGTSTLTQMLHATARSPFELRTLPFDTQRLALDFQVLGFDAGEVVLLADSEDVVKSGTFTRAPEWLAPRLDVTERIVNGHSTITVNLELQRQWFFLTRLVLLPLALIVVLSWSVFWMDRSSLGDRMAVSFVGILTAVAYQNLTSDVMPNIAYMTFLNAFVMASLFIMSASVLENLLVGDADKRGRLQRGDSMDRASRWLFPLAYGLLIGGAWLITSRIL